MRTALDVPPMHSVSLGSFLIGRFEVTFAEYIRWLETLPYWDDARTKEFEQRFLAPLQLDLRNAVGAMDQMAVLLTKIYSECE